MNRKAQCAVGNWAGLLGFAVLILLPAADAMGQSFLGRYCWTLTVTSRETGPVTPETRAIQADAVYLGGDTYSLHAKVTDTGDNPAFYSGSGPLVGGTLYMSMAGSQSHSSSTWRDSSVMHVELDASTLNGTFYDVGTDFNPTTLVFSSHRYTAGSMTYTPTCP